MPLRFSVQSRAIHDSAAFTVIPALAFRREPKFRDDYSLTFSSEGIHFRTAHVDSHLQWSMYSRALIDPHFYVLYYGSRQFIVIPKRVFQSIEQQQAFEQLLAQHVSHIVRRVGRQPEWFRRVKNHTG